MIIHYHTRESWARFVGDRASFTGEAVADAIRRGDYDHQIREARRDIALPLAQPRFGDVQ